MRIHHLLFLILINMVFGLNFVAINYVVADLPPLLTNATRFLIVGLALSPFLRYLKGQMLNVIGVGLSLGIMHFGMFMLAMSITDGVSELSIVNQLSVPFAAILAVALLGETIHLPRIIGIAISFIGVMIMGFDPRIFGHVEALMIMGVSSFFLAFATIQMRNLKHVPAMTIQAWVAVVGLVGSIILTATIESGQVEALRSMGTTAMWGMLYTTLGSSVIGHGGMNYLLRHYEVSVVSPYMLLIPVFGVLGGVLVLGETLSSRMIVGGLLTLSGVGIITLRNMARKAKLEASS